MTMRLRALALAAAAAVVLLAASFAGGGTAATVSAQEATPTATPVTTGNIPVLAISPTICWLLTFSKYDSQAIGAFNGGKCLTMPIVPQAVKDIADINGNGDGIVQPEDFAGIDLDGNQLHQMDDYVAQSQQSSFNGTLFILAWVPNQAPVTFRTNQGVIVPPGNYSGAVPPNPQADPTGQVWTCDDQKGTLTAVEDADCVQGAPGADGVVIATLSGRWGSSIAPLSGDNPGTVTVTQGSTDSATIRFRIVGEPRTLSFTTLESKIQDGTTDGCPLPGAAAGFLGANATAEKSIVLAIAKDINGTPVTGALINWSTSDKDIGDMAAPLTPTIDLGSFGFGAPNILCGQTDPGTVTVTANVLSQYAGLTFDANAQPAILSTDFTTVGVPATVTLTADPATIPCDGTATSKITATVMDAAGNPSAAGQQVHFDTQTLGTSSPVNAGTDDKGVASSTISPLSSLANGVPVVVTAGNVANSILINCTLAGPATPTPPSGTSGGGAGPGVGPITGPNTGTGAMADAGSAGSTWIILLALSTLGLLTGSALVWTGARAKGL